MQSFLLHSIPSFILIVDCLDTVKSPKSINIIAIFRWTVCRSLQTAVVCRNRYKINSTTICFELRIFRSQFSMCHCDKRLIVTHISFSFFSSSFRTVQSFYLMWNIVIGLHIDALNVSIFYAKLIGKSIQLKWHFFQCTGNFSFSLDVDECQEFTEFSICLKFRAFFKRSRVSYLCFSHTRIHLKRIKQKARRRKRRKYLLYRKCGVKISSFWSKSLKVVILFSAFVFRFSLQTALNLFLTIFRVSVFFLFVTIRFDSRRFTNKCWIPRQTLKRDDKNCVKFNLNIP